MVNQGIVWIAYGEAARAEAQQSAKSAAAVHPILPFMIITDDQTQFVSMRECRYHETPIVDGAARQSRRVKTQLNQITPFTYTLYLDADTRVRGNIQSLFYPLLNGFDMVIVPSENQESGAFWHIGQEERAATIEQCGYLPVQLQGGVFAWAENHRTRDFFRAWYAEWERWGDQDQAALARALAAVPLRLWLMGRDFNGGAVVNHLFGRAR
jgi:hypothetical protein